MYSRMDVTSYRNLLIFATNLGPWNVSDALEKEDYDSSGGPIFWIVGFLIQRAQRKWRSVFTIFDVCPSAKMHSEQPLFRD